jgi:hypothetical protein
MFQGSNRIDHSFRGIVGWHTPSRSSTAVGSCAWERIHRYSDRDRARLGSHDAAVVEVRSSRGTVSFSRSPAPIPGGYLLTPRVTCVAVDTPIKPKQLYCGVFPHGQRQPAAACTAASLRTRTLTAHRTGQHLPGGCGLAALRRRWTSSRCSRLTVPGRGELGSWHLGSDHQFIMAHEQALLNS